MDHDNVVLGLFVNADLLLVDDVNKSLSLDDLQETSTIVVEVSDIFFDEPQNVHLIVNSFRQSFVLVNGPKDAQECFDAVSSTVKIALD